MSGARQLKKQFQKLFSQPDWQASIPEIAANGQAAVSPLFSFLPGDPELRHKAAIALGATVAKLAETDFEKACVVIRRFMWHMSEESGNIGWGIPEAFAECLAASPVLAEKYRNILISYIIDLGHDDNYCDNDILRRSCYWAIGRFAQAQPELAEKARPWLEKGLQDMDSPSRGMAAWALAQLGTDLDEAPALRALTSSDNTDTVSVYENNRLANRTVSDLALDALNRPKTRKPKAEDKK